ncbi:helix-turn-helix domain-containing protein [Kutzneria albida]|uniref:HTH cro/C1-type domain-containing protein n=1 Tax=Kutzneria albida DSM 43870 TaxID=1449976 RepID=W5WC01_9PSEU|nr:helix-turn-helix transcriptional regulator [Kutzneria albida]AHH98678.1 hypothetical protein KALB_5316 [Kutzneria albida DSM 43870]
MSEARQDNHSPRSARDRLAEEIHALRDAAGLTQAALATRIGYTKQYVSLAERPGTGLPSDSLVRALDSALGAHGRLTALRAEAAVEHARRRQDLSAGRSAGIGIDTGADVAPAVAASQARWREVRAFLGAQGTVLTTLAAQLYPATARAAGLPVLAAAHWLPESPVPLDQVELDWDEEPALPVITGREAEVASVLPLRAPGRAFASYSTAIRYLAPPRLFENRSCYRLLALHRPDGHRLRLRFGLSTYFAKFDIAEALVHELAAHAAATTTPPGIDDLPYRSLLGPAPFDLAERPVNLSVTTLTIRQDRSAGTAAFYLMRRDGRAVAVGGGHYGLIPAGEFQPASISPQSLRTDLDLWRTMVREYSEELLGDPEHDGSTGVPVDYQCWPFYRDMTRAREAGAIRVSVLGLVMDPLSLNATIATVAVFDSSTFDRLFRQIADSNVEGRLAVKDGATARDGIAFTAGNVDRFVHREVMGATCTACLALAWRHRDALLGQGRP